MGSFISNSHKSCCDTCAKYVLNSMQIKSNCGECCSFEVNTDPIELSDEEDEIEIVDCFYRKHKK